MKKAIIGIGIFAVTAYYYSRSKINDIENIIPNLQPKINTLNAINFGPGIINLNIDLKLTNTTTSSFNANTGSALKLEKAEVFTPGGIKIAEAIKEVSNINLPAYGSVIIQNIDVAIFTENLESIAIELITGDLLNNLIINAHIEALGKKYIV